MSQTFFLTGGTGFLGSNILYYLLKQGSQVVTLVRPKGGLRLLDRLKYPVSIINPDFNLDEYVRSGDLRFVSGDITVESPLLNIDPEIRTSLIEEIDVYINCAASIKFSKIDYPEIWNANVLGTKLSLDLAELLHVDRFCQVSTSYVKGIHSPSMFREWDKGIGPFYNVYERTKSEGEFEVEHRCTEIGLDYSIFRPGVVVGDEQGRALHFDGYYGYFAAFHGIKSMMEKRGEKYGENGKMTIPLATRSERNATLSMVPVDWVSRTMLRLIGNQASIGKTFHLTHPEPPGIRFLIETSLDIMNIAGVRLLDPDQVVDHGDRLLNSFQRRLDQKIRQYESYTCTEDNFDQSFVELVMNSHWVPPPPIDREYLERILDYAAERNFQ